MELQGMTSSETIKGIFFSEFHPTAGPKIVYQDPEEGITEEEFNAVQVYIITKPRLKNKVVTINALGHKIVGCPVCLDNPKYDRNALIFNLCLLFDSSVSTVKYENLVKKLAAYLTTLEVESGFLSTEQTRRELPAVLRKIRHDVNSDAMCSVNVMDTTTIHLKVMTGSSDQITVCDHDVPILSPRQSGSTAKWGLATQQLLSSVDGFRHIARLAAEANVDINFVKQGVQNLVHLGVLQIVSIFQYTNVYVTAPDINRLLEDTHLHETCRKFVARPGHYPELRDIFTLYCSLTAGTTVQDMCTRHSPHAMGIDECNLIQYGAMCGYIRRLHKYPIKLANEPGSHHLSHLYKWFNGCHNYDEICVATGMSHSELDERVERDASIVVVWK